jgi:Galactose oxidase, central domain
VANLLLSGKVLLTGGNDDSHGNESGVELFDPATESFAVSARMSTARDGHTATLLPDGRVLVAGGAGQLMGLQAPVASAEIYDPASGSFSTTGSLTSARDSHTATLLNNGQVLITGGFAGVGDGSVGPFSAIGSVELYTPTVLVPAPVLFSLSGDGKGQGAIWHAQSGQIASADNPAVAGETLSMYTTSLADGGVIPPQVSVGGRLAQVLYFGASSYPGYNQVNLRVPSGVPQGPAAPVRLTYLGRPSNAVTIAVQ